ncbi:SGNH/GDSL hydrolase family protein [Lentzea sp. NPDC042327]|uniref:SGNH/GDSL hydrolase family protein n=1 Tax=Lentzea sp. NPDC042327 TaxID=3154801 RepID=UPI0033E4B752
MVNSTQPVRRFVALGDSLTEGVGDPRPDGSLRGWADVLAGELDHAWPGLRYDNLAVRGWCARHVLEHQVEPALRLKPDLVSVMVGANDAFDRTGFDSTAVGRALSDTVAALRDGGARVIMATLPDITRRWPGPANLHQAMRSRFRHVNDLVRTIADQHDAIMHDLWHDERTYAPRMWSIDRVHPGTHGHAGIAHTFAELLVGRARTPWLPAGPPVSAAQRLAEVRSLYAIVRSDFRRSLPSQLPRGRWDAIGPGHLTGP